MMTKHNLPLRLAVLTTAIFISLSPVFVGASTIDTSTPGRTVVTDNDHDLQLKNCILGNPDWACSLPLTAPTGYFPPLDIVAARITLLPGTGLVEMAIDLNGPVPDTPSAGFISWFWTFENGCVGAQPGPTTKDAVRVNWDGSNFTAHWMVITNCDPREIQQGDPIGFSFESNRETIKVQVDICDLVSRAGESLTWHAGVRLVGFANPNFPKSIGVDYAPDVAVFNPYYPPTPPQVFHPEEAAPWHGACASIDIKPDSFPNSINSGSRGSIPVAILSNPTFDAPSRVDQANLLFGRTGDEESLDFCSGPEDVNSDGLFDLVCHFNTVSTGFQQGDTQGILKAYTNDPSPAFIVGRDSVLIVPAR